MDNLHQHQGKMLHDDYLHYVHIQCMIRTYTICTVPSFIYNIQYNIIVQASATASNPTELLDVDSIPVTKLDLGIFLVIG